MKDLKPLLKIELLFKDINEFEQKTIGYETNFSDFFEAIGDMFIINDLNGDIKYANKSLINKLEYSLLELRNMNNFDLYPINRIAEVSDILEKLIRGETDYCPLEVVSKSGKIYSVETRIWFGKYDNEDCIFSISKDITREEENLELFSRIFENNPLPMCITSIDEGRFIKVNPAYVEKLGYSKEEIIGKTGEEINMFVDIDRKGLVNNRQLGREKARYKEVLIRSKDGSLINGLFTIETIITQGEESLLTSMVDITEKLELTKDIEDKYRKLTNIIEGANLGTWEWNIKSGEIEINEQWAKMIGYSLEELQPTTIETWHKFTHPEDLKISNKNIAKHLNGEKKYYECKFRMKHRDGRWIWVRDRGKVTERNNNGQPLKMFGTHSDITIEQEKSLELERFFSVNLDLLCIVDMEGNFIKTNKAWEDVLGYSSDELKGHKVLEFIHEDDIDSTVDAIEQLNKYNKVTNFVNRYISIEGESCYIEWRASPHGSMIYAAARDITERIEYERKILEISNRDALTGIYNRRYIYDRLGEIIEEYKRVGNLFSVCIIDIDHFKIINDTYGHQIGDCILKEFTKIVEGNLRPYDILGRYGGEEFIVVFKNTDKKDSSLVLERILNIVRNKTFDFDRQNIKLTFSAGIVNCNEVGKSEVSIDGLINIADKRMYQSKKTGRNKIVFKTS